MKHLFEQHWVWNPSLTLTVQRNKSSSWGWKRACINSYPKAESWPYRVFLVRHDTCLRCSTCLVQPQCRNWQKKGSKGSIFLLFLIASHSRFINTCTPTACDNKVVSHIFCSMPQKPPRQNHVWVYFKHTIHTGVTGWKVAQRSGGFLSWSNHRGQQKVSMRAGGWILPLLLCNSTFALGSF